MTPPPTVNEQLPAPNGPSKPHQPVRTVVATRVSLDAAPLVDKPTTLTAGQRERAAVIWSRGDNSARAGLWGCQPGRFTAVRDGVAEVCYIVSGRATLRDASGEATEVAAGSLLVLPDGWNGTWEVHEPIEKVFVVIPS